MIISIDTEKTRGKIQHFLTFFHDKNSQKTRNRMELPRHDKGHL